MQDILFKTEDFIFSYRVAGILVNEDKILLQRYKNDENIVHFVSKQTE